ncbi:MAG: ABC transporter substrate-binding protein [Mycetocola sp.]
MKAHKRGYTRAGGVLATISVALLAATGCAGGGSSSPDSTAVATDGTIRAVATAEPVTLNPVLIRDNSYRVAGAMFDGVVGTDDTGLPDDSGLATSWTSVDDTTWQFTLRDGVTFHDGTDFSAEDVAFTIAAIQENPKAPYATFYKRIVSVETPDDLTITVTTATPDSSIPALFTTLRPVPSEYYEEVGAEGFESAPIGTGPYMFDSKQPGQSLTLTRYDDYWGGAGQVKTLEFTYSADAAARVSLLQAGDVDVIYEAPSQSASQLESSGAQVASGPVATTLVLFTRVPVDPSEQATEREAASLAVDRDVLLEGVMKGNGEPQNRVITQSLTEAAEPEIAYDPDEATDLVAGTGPKIRLMYSSGAYEQDKAIGEAIAAMLTDVGFTVTQEIKTIAEMYEAETLPASPDEALMTLHPAQATYPDPDVQIGYYVLTLGLCGDPAAFQPLALEGLSSVDPAERAPAYEEMEDMMINQNHCMLPIAQMLGSFGVADSVGGFQVPYVGTPDWTTVTVSE